MPPHPSVQAPNGPRLRPGCPLTRQDLSAVRTLRRKIRENGYDRVVAIHSPWSTTVDPANAGKQPLTEVEGVNGQKIPWVNGHSEVRLNRVTPQSANTGIVLGGRHCLVALDIDPAKGVSDAEQFAFTEDMLTFLRSDRAWPMLATALRRLRAPASVVLLFRTDRPMPKAKVMGQRGAIERLGEGQQVVVHGNHPLSLNGPEVRWFWSGGRAPWNVPVAQLPVVPAIEAEALMHRIQASGVLGAPKLQLPTNPLRSGQHRASRYPATERLNALFDKYDGLVRPAIRELIEQVGAEGSGRHDAIVAVCGRLVTQKWTGQHAVEFLAPLANQYFNEGDWTGEIASAFAHAHQRDTARLAGQRSAVWK